MFFCPALAQRLAARASSDATGAYPVSSNVAARHSKTVISRANLLALFYFRHSAASLRARFGAKRRDGNMMNGQVLFPGIFPSSSREEEGRDLINGRKF
jgi:hypothetical protein